jgi:hypothetical protein
MGKRRKIKKQLNRLRDRNTNWVKRADAENKLSTIDDKTHYMTHAEGDGRFYVYPLVREDPSKFGMLRELGDREAIDASIKNRDALVFDNEEDAEWAASVGYKQFTNFPKEEVKRAKTNYNDMMRKRKKYVRGGTVRNKTRDAQRRANTPFPSDEVTHTSKRRTGIQRMSAGIQSYRPKREVASTSVVNLSRPTNKVPTVMKKALGIAGSAASVYSAVKGAAQAEQAEQAGQLGQGASPAPPKITKNKRKQEVEVDVQDPVDYNIDPWAMNPGFGDPRLSPTPTLGPPTMSDYSGINRSPIIPANPQQTTQGFADGTKKVKRRRYKKGCARVRKKY